MTDFVQEVLPLLDAEGSGEPRRASRGNVTDAAGEHARSEGTVSTPASPRPAGSSQTGSFQQCEDASLPLSDSTPARHYLGHGEPTMTARRPPRPAVEVRTSPRRRKTASAFWQDGRVVVVLPARLPRAERGELVEGLVRRVLAQRPSIT